MSATIRDPAEHGHRAPTLDDVTVLEALDAARLSEITASETSLRRFLHGLPGVDQVGADARAAMLSTRSIKTTAKQWAINLAISMIDLTTLEGQDTPGKVRALCAKAQRPDPSDPSVPHVAAVCVYPDLVGVAAKALAGSGIHIASVATGFPSGRASAAAFTATVLAAWDGRRSAPLWWTIAGTVATSRAYVPAGTTSPSEPDAA